jgi:protein involved in polysaccharide export with SLBB domain
LEIKVNSKFLYFGFFFLWIFLVSLCSCVAAASTSAIQNMSTHSDDEDFLNELTSVPSKSKGVDNVTPIATYGSNLFHGNYAMNRGSGLNSSYLVSPGDKISINLWGAVSQSDVAVVDNQGNIFIPGVGPISLGGVPAHEVNDVVTQSIKSVYHNNVNVYVNLLSATPVNVFVSGPVIRPGQYAGQASDSLLFFLSQAGGIDVGRGSFRKIEIIRNGEVHTRIDLYDFLNHGEIQTVPFRNGDVILVKQQGPTVSVLGDVRNSFKFELLEGQSLGGEVSVYARPLTKVTHVGVVGDRENGSVAVYFAKSDFESFVIGDGDIVTYNDDSSVDMMSVKLSGSFVGPSIYAVSKGTKLKDLLNHVEVDLDQADISSIYIKRESVAIEQKKLLNDSLNRLERSVYTAPAGSDGESRIRAQEASLVSEFVERARKITPLGKVVVSDNSEIADIRLEQGDEIVIPEKSDLVQVAGHVMFPQAVVYNSEATVHDYIAWAGGVSEIANIDKIAIVHANGLVSYYVDDLNLWFSHKSNQIKAGDQILVLAKVDTKLMQSIKDITQIVAQVALIANVALN